MRVFHSRPIGLGLLLGAGALPLLAAAPEEAGRAPAEELTFPLVRGAGGVIPLPQAPQQPRRGTRIVFDITAAGGAADVHKGLDRVARCLNLYAAGGVKGPGVRVTAVLHGDATAAALSDEAYAARLKEAKNPNLPLIRALKQAGAEVLVCGQALHYKGFRRDEVAPEVPVAYSAMTAIVNRQAEGYAYLPVH